MSAYLKFFELQQSPFEGRTPVVLGTKALRDAFALIRSGLDEGDARICVSGGPGLGKTSLARALPKLLGNTARVAVVLDPDLSWESLRGSISKQWGLASGGLARAALIEAARERRLVLVIDQAERASEEFLDHLDIVLCYRSENDDPVVQSVLFACLSGHAQQGPAPIVWWLDRIQTLQLEFAPLPRDGIESYIRKHLKRAGWRGEQLFTRAAALAIHGYTGGVPGEISRLCERLLTEAASRDRHDIDATFVHLLCNEGEIDDDSGLEVAFDDADTTTHSAPSAIESEETVSEPSIPSTLGETLEPFQANEQWVGQDDPLSAPASPEELRAILGSGRGRLGRAFAAATIAALIGGLAFAWLAAETGPPKPTAAERLERARPGRAGPTEPEPTASSESAPMVLARLRGPISRAGTVTPAAPETRTPIEAAEEDFDEEISENDLIDPQPASRLPDST